MRKIIVLAAVLVALASPAYSQATDTFASYRSGLASPSIHAFAVTPDDSNDLANVTRALYIGGGGTIVVVTAGGETVTFVGTIGGTVLPLRVARVKSTGTTATNIVGLY